MALEPLVNAVAVEVMKTRKIAHQLAFFQGCQAHRTGPSNQQVKRRRRNIDSLDVFRQHEQNIVKHLMHIGSEDVNWIHHLFLCSNSAGKGTNIVLNRTTYF